MSELSILNVGAGDVKVSFDKSNPAERIRACRIVKDMLRRGYALLVEVERDGKKAFERALDFDEDRAEYIIADFDPVWAGEADREEKQTKQWHDDNAYVDQKLKEEGQINGESSENKEDGAEISASESGEVPEQTGERGAAGRGGKRKGKGKTGRIAADSTRAVGVARSAGG